jgi:hypothetical protein
VASILLNLGRAATKRLATSNQIRSAAGQESGPETSPQAKRLAKSIQNGVKMANTRIFFGQRRSAGYDGIARNV